MNPIAGVQSRAPVRIDLAGGWTDVAEFCSETPGHVVNLTIDRYVHAELTPRRSGVEIVSDDYGLRLPPRELADLTLEGPLALLEAAVRRLPPTGGLRLRTGSDVPPQSGLGTSAATGVAVLAALTRCRFARLGRVELAELASALERADLGIRGGKQDHYASAQGGVRFMTFHGEQVTSERLDLPPLTEADLEAALVLVHTGSDHDSGAIHQEVSDAWQRGDASVRGAIEELKEVAPSVKDRLLACDLAGLAHAVETNWALQKKLDPRITTARIESLFAVASANGARTGKACGAGGGGCVVFVCEPGRTAAVAAALRAAGGEVLPFRLEPRGVAASGEP